MNAEKTNLAPIVLFGYNRPKHIKITLEALSKNELASNTELFIFIDGHKNKSDKNLNLEAVRVCENFNWPGSLKIINHRSRNYGLAENIISGVTEIVNEKGKVIVVEDDIETSRGFLKYMNDALDFYQLETKVMHISGYMFPVKNHENPQTLFYQSTSCWGWATWNDRWQCLETNPRVLLSELQKGSLFYWFDLDSSGIFLNQLDRNISGAINTWAIKWQASVNLKNGFSLHPFKSLTRNIGFDGSGENCGESEVHLNQELVNNIDVKSIPIVFDAKFRGRMIKFYKPSISPIHRVKNILRLFLIKTNLLTHFQKS